MEKKSFNFKKLLYILIPILLVAVIIIKLKSNKQIATEKVYTHDKNAPIYVSTQIIKNEKISSNFSFSGSFEPNKETKLSAEVQGKINSIPVDAGSYVHQGQQLVQLDNSLLKLQLQNTQIQIDGLETDVKRYTILANADAIQGVQLEKAVLGLKSAKVQKATLLEQIAKSSIKAPFSGYITAKLAEVGSFASPGIPLLQLTDISRLKFTINVSENDLNKFNSGKKFTIIPDAYPDITLSSSFPIIGSKSNNGSSFPVQFSANNILNFKIKSGMFGKVSFDNSNKEIGIMIPVSATISSQNTTQVYVIQNKKAVLKNITISKKIDNNVVVSSGLSDGDVIAIDGFINLFDNANVSIKN
jgi:RND family efflux transporter MFP subunit